MCEVQRGGLGPALARARWAWGLQLSLAPARSALGAAAARRGVRRQAHRARVPPPASPVQSLLTRMSTAGGAWRGADACCRSLPHAPQRRHPLAHLIRRAPPCTQQLAVYGKESMRRMATCNVLIAGLGGLGVEVGACVVGAGLWGPAGAGLGWAAAGRRVRGGVRPALAALQLVSGAAAPALSRGLLAGRACAWTLHCLASCPSPALRTVDNRATFAFHPSPRARKRNRRATKTNHRFV